ncbi:MAG: metallophosphoesterase family protein [Phycisphaerae bacterium]|nr:metallophosphoesterase family protein [Phycisphaerae bacterium]
MLRGLRWWEQVVAVGVPLGAVVVAVLAASVLIRWFVRSARRRPGPSRRWRRITERVLVGLFVVELLCGLYAWGVEPYWPEVTRHRIVLSQLPPQSSPIRLVHISDTHCDAKVRLEDELPERIAALEPDAIVFTGDAINAPAGRENFRTLMRSLRRIAPVYAVTGNWESITELSVGPLYADAGVRVLDGAARPLGVSAGNVWLAGSADGDVDGLLAALAEVPDDAAVVVLHHRPDAIERVARAGGDVYCAGHTHGGQVALPFYGAMVTLSRHGRRFARGRHRVGETTLLVNRGIGTEGGRAPRIRFCSRPEIGLIELVPASGDASR